MTGWPRAGFGAVLLAVPALLGSGGPAEEALIEAAGGSHRDGFGWSVAVQGDTAVVGAINDEPPVSAGSAYVFSRSAEGWQEVATLVSGDPEVFGLFGWSVSIHEDTLIVGAYREDTRNGPDAGAAYVFARRGSAWLEEAALVASDGQTAAGFGSSVSVYGDTAVVGAWSDPELGGNAGAAYVFTRDSGVWTEETKLLAPDGVAGDLFGISVSLYGDTVAIGAANENNVNGINAGSVYVFVRNGSTWTPQAKLRAGEGASEDLFGFSVSLEGDTLAVGAENATVAGFEGAGAAYVFVRDGTLWSEQAKVTASDGLTDDSFGISVSVSGNTLAVGAYLDDAPGLPSSGSGYVFTREATAWSEIAKLTASTPNPLEQFGYSCCVSGDTALFGVPDKKNSFGINPGGAYVYRLDAPLVYCTAGLSASGCAAQISAAGTASSSAPSGFTLTTTGVHGATSGLYYFGTGGRQASPWGNGTSYQCVVPPVTRSDLLNGGGSSGACNGVFVRDLNATWCPSCPKPQHNPGSGATVQAQLWYRDPFSTSNVTTATSNAVEFCVGL